MHTLTTEDPADQRTEREQKAKTKTKTIKDEWPAQVNRFCRLCDVDAWEDLPECWHQAAGLKKGGGTTLALLQDQVNILAAKLDCRPLFVTTQHSNAVTGWNFAGGLLHQLGTGVLPFTVTPPGAVSGEALAQLSHCPLPAALPGKKHAVVKACRDGFWSCRPVRGDCQHNASRMDGPQVDPGRFVCWFHAQLQWWFRETWSAANEDHCTPVPDFSKGFQTFAQTQNLGWLPRMSHLSPLQGLQGRGRSEATDEELESSESTGVLRKKATDQRTNPGTQTCKPGKRVCTGSLRQETARLGEESIPRPPTAADDAFCITQKASASPTAGGSKIIVGSP